MTTAQTPTPSRLVLALAFAWGAAIAAVSVFEHQALWTAFGVLKRAGPGLGLSLLYFGTAYVLGNALVSRTLPDFSRREAAGRALVSTALGWAIIEALCVGLGLMGLAGVTSSVLILGLSLAFLREARPPTVPSFSPLQALAASAALLVSLPLILQIAAPPTGPDELQYHQRFVEHLVRTGGFLGDPLDPTSAFAQGMHSLMALPATFTGTIGMRSVSLLFGFGALASGFLAARRIFGRGAGALSLLIALTSATGLRVLPLMNTDWPLAFFLGAALLLVLDWIQAPSQAEARPWLLALLGGAALGIKYTAPFFFAPFYLVLFFRILFCPPSKGRARAFLSLGLASLLPALFALPWLIRNQAIFGHPLYPFMGLHFGEASDLFRFNFSANYGGGSGLMALLHSPYELFVTGQEFDRRHFLGRLNPWPLLALPGVLIGLRQNRAAQDLAAGVSLSFLLWALVLKRVTYLLPLWPLIAVLTAGGLFALLSWIREDRRRAASGVLAATILSTLAVETAGPIGDHFSALPVASGAESESRYLDREVDDAIPLRWLREQAAEDHSILLAWSWHAWDLPNRIIGVGAEDFSAFRAWLDTFENEEALGQALDREGVRWVLEREARYFRQNYPMLTDEEFERGFQRPLALVERFLSRRGKLRFSHGPYRVWSVLPAGSTAPQTQPQGS